MSHAELTRRANDPSNGGTLSKDVIGLVCREDLRIPLKDIDPIADGLELRGPDREAFIESALLSIAPAGLVERYSRLKDRVRELEARIAAEEAAREEEEGPPPLSGLA